MTADTAMGLVVTSIAPPTPAMRALAEGAAARGVQFFCIGDRKSPASYELPGCRFVSLQEQLESPFRYARACPVGHYARKNIGYLYAIAEGCRVIVETDDDNRPRAEFWAQRTAEQTAQRIGNRKWVNVYRCFTDHQIWPRGFPLECLETAWGDGWLDGEQTTGIAPVQQGLADGDPDVDAVYRLTRELPVEFTPAPPVLLDRHCWTPFNSQNTTWFAHVFPLMYLPAHCSFRMTDIWRSFVVQACLWVNDWRLLVHGATVFQERNDHDLLRDFEQEIPGYLNNDKIVDVLSALPLRKGEEHLGENLRTCYEALVGSGCVGREELPLLDAWIEDVERLRAGGNAK